jgi:hypothetical protein
MDYYHRPKQDGSYEVICTRCFLTVGLAAGIEIARTLEAQHICPKANSASVAPLSGDHPKSVRRRLSPQPARSLRFVARAKETHFALLSLTVIVVVYVLPTGFELIATPHLGPWAGTIFLGDVCGCLCLASVFKLPRTGVILYAVLTICEAVLYAGRLLPASAILWITDLVPTLVVMAKVMSLQSPGRWLKE